MTEVQFRFCCYWTPNYWAGQIEALCDTYDVVALDLPGHGRTPGGPADCTLDAMVRCLERVIRTTGAGPVHLVGLSVGGMIAQALTLAQSDLVRSLTLIYTAAFAEEGRTAMRARAKSC